MAARGASVHAMMDLSDGLGLDLHRLADASGVGFALDDVPVAEGATLEEAISGGEDYELLIATDDVARLRESFASRGLREPIEIGRVVADPPRSHARWARSSCAGATNTGSRASTAPSVRARGLDDLARAQTAGADVHALGRAVHKARTRWMFGFQRRLVRRCE